MELADHIRPTFVEVDLEAVRNNVRHFRNHVGPQVQVYGVVKADAYGHGAIAVANAISPLCDKLAVSLCEEALALRMAKIAAPILVLGAYYGNEHRRIVQGTLTPVVSDPADLEKFADAVSAMNSPQPLSVHLKVDTGMSRLGLGGNELDAALKTLSSRNQLHLEGLCTHLACADEPDDHNTQEQLRSFAAVRARFARSGVSPQFVHVANSAAALRFPNTHFDAIRPGISLYGSVASTAVPSAGLSQVLSLKSRIMKVHELPQGKGVSYGYRFVTQRPSRIAVLPVGYADGYPRHVTGAHILVRGQRAPVAGTVCMDMIMVDITDVPGAAVGDDVCLIGTDGRSSITVSDLANWAGTISYEITCGLSKRVPRRYKNSSPIVASGTGLAHG
jgi:alanine racemase